MKSHLRWSRASGSTRRRVERLIRQGERSVRRHFISVERPHLYTGNEASIMKGRNYVGE